MSIETVKSNINASIKIKQKLLDDEKVMWQIVEISTRCIDALKHGGKIIFCGNGGSFADAQHLSAEFSSRFLLERPGLASIALGTNSSAMSAIGNDYGFDSVFSREIEAIANPVDVIIAISTSGNSLNIIKALESAKAKKIFSVVFTGAGMGNLANDSITVNVPSRSTARIQECHILLGHILCGLVEDALFGEI